MDNPQHYQPLSHALHPPVAPSHPRSPFNPGAVYTPPLQQASIPTRPAENPTTREEEEEEEEEHDDDDEGLVEKELNQGEGENHASRPNSPPRPRITGPDGHNQPTQDSRQHTEPKRRPGRPRGSKNRKLQRPSQSVKDAGTAPISGPPPHPDINSGNQQYYEFQWRILNLCAEFYGAAEELVKGTNPLVIAQCYHMGPPSKVDPIILLSDAKRTCDALLANPSQLVINPPPPMYPVMPQYYSHGAPPSNISTATAGASNSKQPASAVLPTTVITNPQSFVVPLTQPGFPPPQYPVYAPGQYPTTPYYQFPFTHPHYYAPPPPVTSTPQPQPHVTLPVQTISSTGVPPSTAWADDDVERLKKLAEESKGTNGSGEIDWDYVVRGFEDKRTRHQILIKATALGLKESSTRGTKRRRENDAPGDGAPMSNLGPSTTNAGPSTSGQLVASPSHSQPTSTPTASPALPHQQRPPSSTSVIQPPAGPGNAQTTIAPTPGLPWPMPTVAASTGSPAGSQEPQRTSYYRPRPTSDSSKSTTPQQHFMYTPNGHAPRSVRDPL